MTELFFHGSELYVQHKTSKAMSIRINFFNDVNLIIYYKYIWIPFSQIILFKKTRLPNGENMYILDIPEWLVSEKKLQEHYYEDPLEFIAKIDKLKKGYRGGSCLK
jgi:hypothetical protein